MKFRGIIFILICLITLTMFSGCAAPTSKLPELKSQVSSNASQNTSANENSSAVESAAPEKTVDDTLYEDTFEGLSKYLEDSGIITGTPVNMEYSVIGATAGTKYNFTYSGKTVQVELYMFDTANLNQEAKRVIESVKQNGTFELLDATIHAVLSTNDKYMMIYTDADKSDVNVVQSKRANEVFLKFKNAGGI